MVGVVPGIDIAFVFPLMLVLTIVNIHAELRMASKHRMSGQLPLLLLAGCLALPQALQAAQNPPDMGPRRLPSYQSAPVEALDNSLSGRAPGAQNAPRASDSWKEFEKPARVEISTGYRQDNLGWNIAYDTSGTIPPNILSELKWKNVNNYLLRANGEVIVPEGLLRGLYLNASGYRGWVASGRNQDSDYDGNDRTLEFSRSNNKADEGDTLGASAAVGYAFDWKTTSPVQLIRLIGLGGYSYDKQKFSMTDGVQTLSECSIYYGCIVPAVGPFAGLDSSYNARWRGPFLGLDLGLRVADRHSLRMRGQYHWTSYNGQANWNLRSDFLHNRSFEHDADGTGYLLSLMYAYALTESVDLTLAGEYQRFTTDPGLDRTYTIFGTDTTRLNEVKWDAKLVRVGMDYRF